MSLESVFNETWSDDHQSGVVAVVGRPNVGKSTLINAILGQKIAIATPKPQTTRRVQLGIYSTEMMQILLTDTPGLHAPRNTLGEYMMAVAEKSLKDADVILWILDVSEPPQKSDSYIAETIQAARGSAKLILVYNKVDLAGDNPDFSAFEALIEHDDAIAISALKKQGVDALLEAVKVHIPLGPRYYPIDQVSDLNMRFITAEIVREKVIINTEKEIPHSVAVEVTEYKDREERTDIYATIHVEKESQKGIIIGKGGKMIKIIGSLARQDLEKMLDRQVFLDLHVKVLKNWRTNEQFMRRVGYTLPKEDDN
ncbi:MAG: GTPase Era [Phototrophicaceae bacterium]